MNPNIPTVVGSFSRLSRDIGSDVLARENVPRSRSGASVDVLCNVLGIQNSDRVLDVGCGEGFSAIRVAKKTGAHIGPWTEEEDRILMESQRRMGTEHVTHTCAS